MQREESKKLNQLPIVEQSKALRRDAEILLNDIEFGREIRSLLNRFGNADLIPESELVHAVSGSDWPPGMAHALAKVLEEREKEKRRRVH